MTAIQTEMEQLVLGLPTKSEKIRTLGKAGYSRRQIADFLGIRYQHVRNVLVDAERVGRGPMVPADSSAKVTAMAGQVAPSMAVRMESGGRFALSDDVLHEAGFREGDVLFVQATSGEIHLMSPQAAMREAQALVRKFVPENVSLVDELTKQRRHEAGRG